MEYTNLFLCSSNIELLLKEDSYLRSLYELLLNEDSYLWSLYEWIVVVAVVVVYSSSI